MPQMSPLGWAWMVVFVILGYFLFLMLFYFMFKYEIVLDEIKIKFMSFVWLW
uniref:ATP synthase subunit 8 n=1 Tax=Uroctonus mordax TaxID=507508 RepID=B2CKX3_9SCOR|nr:ATP synthase F0 subunit 8 [Uroctonus mordax]ACA62672.1 ATP synthase subunit 8 [Uroctonus mordax]